MIPVLFEAGTSDFSSNGLGRLPDAISCTVEEERNGKYELEMIYPLDGLHYSDIVHSRIIRAKPSDGKDPQPFRIYYISRPMDGKVTIRAEHISYQLSHIPVSPFSAKSLAAALVGLKANAAENCPFEFWTNKTVSADFDLKEPRSVRACLGGVRGSILDTFGTGEYEFDNYTVRLWLSRGSDKGVTLRYGKNITDIKQEENIADTITGIYPFWKSTEMDGVDPVVVELPERVLHSENSSNFPYQRTITLDVSGDFQTAPTEEQLRERARAYMQANNVGVPKVSVKVSFAPLWQSEEYRELANLERVNLCDTVAVKFEKLGISTTSKVIATKYNVLTERYDEITLGDAKSSLAATLKGDIDGVSEDILQSHSDMEQLLQKELEEATRKITGGTDGFIKQIFNENGQWSELVAMDTNNPATATKVWRMNYEGIGGGYGYDGPFTITMTLDGKINASQINTGVLNAILIRAGVLTDINGQNYWDLDTGEFRLAPTTKVGNETIQDIADSAAGDAVSALTQEAIFNRLTNGGKDQGIILKDGKLYINASYIQSGTISAKLIKGDTLTLGGKNNEDGRLIVNNASGQQVGKWDKDGISVSSGSITGGSINGATITVGGNNNASGVIKVNDANGTQVGKWDKDGISLSKGKLSSADDKVYVDLTNGEISCTQLVGKRGTSYYYLKVGQNDHMMQLSQGGSTGAASLQFDMPSSGDWIIYNTHHLRVGCYSNSEFYGVAANASASTILRAGSYNMSIDSRGMLTASGLISAYLPDNSYVGSSRIATASSSSRRYKHNIKPLSSGRDARRLLSLPVVEFEWNDDHPLQYDDMRGQIIPGIIAEDVAKIYPSAVIHDPDTGEIESWDERRLIPGMLALIQEQQKQIELLMNQVLGLEETINTISQR